MKKLKKSRFRDFRSKKIVIFHYLLLRMFIDKVKNFCDHSMILREMAANQKPIGTL